MNCANAEGTYDIGSLVRIFTTFTQNAAPVNPGAVRLKIKPPDEPIATYVYGVDPDLARPSTGAFHKDIIPTICGQWWYRWESDAPGQGAKEGSFFVRKSEFY